MGWIPPQLKGLQERTGLFHWKDGYAQLQEAWTQLSSQCPPLGPCIIIGGSNGKGSCSSFLWQMHQASGLKTSLYTSPHLIDYTERIQIGELFPSRQAVEQALNTVWPFFKKPPSFFEWTTLAALWLIARETLDCNVLEVGMGGQWDAVNILNPVATCLTSLSLEHQDILGHSMEEIAIQKLGITRPHIPLVCDQAFLPWIPKDVPFFFSPRDFESRENEVVLFPPLVHKPLSITYPKTFENRPKYLKDNWAMACALFHLTSSKPFPGLLPSEPKSLAFRWEKVCFPNGQGPSMLWDGAHNPAGIEALTKGCLEMGLWPEGIVFGVSKDKEALAMLKTLEKLKPRKFLLWSPPPRGWAQNDVPSSWREHSLWIDDPNHLREILIREPSESFWLLCGSLYGLGFLREMWNC